MRWILVVMALLGAGCEGAVQSGKPAACQTLGEQCKLPAGPLGVCTSVPCAPGAQGPCLACTSQH